jgi:hypothetical protein
MAMIFVFRFIDSLDFDLQLLQKAVDTIEMAVKQATWALDIVQEQKATTGPGLMSQATLRSRKLWPRP